MHLLAAYSRLRRYYAPILLLHTKYTKFFHSVTTIKISISTTKGQNMTTPGNPITNIASDKLDVLELFLFLFNLYVVQNTNTPNMNASTTPIERYVIISK